MFSFNLISLRKKIPCHLTNQRFKISFIQLLLSVNSEKFIFHFELLVKNCQIFNPLILLSDSRKFRFMAEINPSAKK